MSKYVKLRLLYLSPALFVVFILAGFLMPNLEAEAVKTDPDQTVAVNTARVPAYMPGRAPASTLNPSDRESVFSPLPSAAWVVPYQTTANQKLIDVLVATSEKAGSFAKNVGQSLGDYVKERQIEGRQQELIRRFYEELDAAVRPLHLVQPEYDELVRRVEKVYIEDGETGAFKLDTASFRDLPAIVKAQRAEMQLKKVTDGTVETYYPSGALKTRWNLAGGKLNGAATTYYEDGEILYIDAYREGLKIHRQKFDKEGKLDFEQTYDYEVPKVPQPSGLPSQTDSTQPASDPSDTVSQAEVLPVV